MTIRRYLPALALLLTAAAPGGSDRELAGYAVRLAIAPAPGGGVQRIELPAAAIVALRNRDGSDIRVFDARGRALPIARVAPGPRLRSDTIAASPILGRRDSRLGARVSVRLDERGQARVAEVASAPPGHDGAVAVLGALLDARNITGSVQRLILDAEIPAGQPIRFAVEASRDLDTWRTVGERVLYRAPGAAWTGAAVALDGADLDRDYLRVTWSAASTLIAPVTVRQAVLIRADAAEQVSVAAKLPPLIGDHAVEFIAPVAPLSSLGVVPAAGDGPTPIRLLGRDGPELPWMLLASGLARAGGMPLSLDGAIPRTLRIEADQRGPGFSALPQLQLGFSRQAIAFVGTGDASLTLVAGREGAADMFTPLATLSPASELPEAVVQGGSSVAPLTLVAPESAAGSRLNVLLWALLLAAVALLAGLVWVMVRARRG